MPIKFLLLGGGVLGVSWRGGGVEVPILFSWARGFSEFDFVSFFRSRPGKPNQKKGQNEKFVNSAHFCEFWCFP